MGTFVALGDSITLGIGDPLPGAPSGWRGWAALLAAALPGLAQHNFAASGALTREVERGQLPRALELRPELAAVIVGVNDTLRQDFDPVAVAAALAHTVGALRASGALVMTMRLPDAGRMFGLPGILARPLARRMAVVNAAVEELATRFGTVHFDAAAHPATYDRRMWSVDRLHPSERGHRFIASEFFDRLVERGFPVGERPGTEPTSLPPTRRAQLGWLATKGTRWVIDRSTDLIPGLLVLAAREALGRPAEPLGRPAEPLSGDGQDAAQPSVPRPVITPPAVAVAHCDAVPGTDSAATRGRPGN